MALGEGWETQLGPGLNGAMFRPDAVRRKSVTLVRRSNGAMFDHTVAAGASTAFAMDALHLERGTEGRHLAKWLQQVAELHGPRACCCCRCSWQVIQNTAVSRGIAACATNLTYAHLPFIDATVTIAFG
jgi:hypothetical protein